MSQLRRWAKRGVRVSSGRPLCQAVGCGKIDVARLLVNGLEADVNGIDEQGFTPLCIAA
jgi:ankyrin repeat protein